MSDSIDSSFEGDDSTEVTMNCVSTDYADDEDQARPIPIKKLQDTFDSLAKPEDLKDTSFKVFLRVRPILESLEITANVVSDTAVITNAPSTSVRAKHTKLEERQYTFNRVFGPTSTQKEIFDVAVEPLVARFLNNESGVLFAYGMTNAGKTYTIQGVPQDHGIIPLFIERILEHTSKFVERSLQVSMVEIYNDNVFDLNIKPKPKLKVRDANGRVEICQLSTNNITNVNEAIKIFDKAAANRCQASTLLNSGSSRSHAIYIFTLSHRVNGTGNEIASSVFQIVDLAGAERMVRTESNKSQQTEANSINKSLMQLWLCLDKMKKKNSSDTSGTIIPFRENKLTHLLMPLLSRVGLSGIALITCINPQASDYDETISILDNASLAQEIREITDIGRTVPNTSNNNDVNKSKTIITKKNSRGEVVTTTDNKAGAGGGGAKKRKMDTSTTDTNTNNAKMNKESKDSIELTYSRDDCDNSSRNTNNNNNYEDNDNDNIDSERKRLHREIERLQDENEHLHMKLITVESNVRMEVSKEMAESSAYLLDRIRELQEMNQPSSSSTSTTRELGRSCKKERRKHMENVAEEMAQNLEEANEECERLKIEFDMKEMQLKAANAALSMELSDLRMKYDMAQKTLASMPKMTSASSTSPNHMSGSVMVMPPGSSYNNSNTNSQSKLHALAQCSKPQFTTTTTSNSTTSASSAAESFNLRMGRDHRFQKYPLVDNRGDKGANAIFIGDENVQMGPGVQKLAKAFMPQTSTDANTNSNFAHMRLRSRLA